MKRLRGLCLSLAGLMLMTTPALAADYNFETLAPKDFYGSTSYEEVYGAQYNYGGTNAVDFLDPLADSAPRDLHQQRLFTGIGDQFRKWEHLPR